MTTRCSPNSLITNGSSTISKTFSPYPIEVVNVLVTVLSVSIYCIILRIWSALDFMTAPLVMKPFKNASTSVILAGSILH